MADVPVLHNIFLAFDAEFTLLFSARFPTTVDEVLVGNNFRPDKVFHKIYNFYTKMIRRFSPHAPGFCIFCRKDIHDAISGFDEEIKLAEDHDYVSRAGKITRFNILKSHPILVSVRRFDRDGRLNIALRYLAAELYIQTKGPIKTDIFKYRFGYKKQKR